MRVIDIFIYLFYLFNYFTLFFERPACQRLDVPLNQFAAPTLLVQCERERETEIERRESEREREVK
jgi:hypothetical protein